MPAAIAALLLAAGLANSALAQKRGGTLKVYFFDSPATMSIHEESTIAGQGPAMGVFNNLVMYDQHVPQSRAQHDRARSRDRMVVERGAHDAHLQSAPGRQMA